MSWCFTLCVLSLPAFTLGACSIEEDCGWKGTCSSGNSCDCPQGYDLHPNGRDCVNKNCTSITDCLECTDEVKCSRCAYFLEENSRTCLDKCTGEAKFVYSGDIQGSVCVAAGVKKKDNSDIIIGVVAGVSSGLLLCIVVAVIFCLHLRRTRRNVNLQEKHYTAANMQVGSVTKVPMYDNSGFEPDINLTSNVIDREVYLLELEKIRPHAHTLLTLLNQIRNKLRDMGPNDARVPTYKGVIHQLCRVLVLLHKKDIGASIPSDALGLLEWAHQMLDDYRLENPDSNTSGGTSSDSHGHKISYVDVPPEKQINPYATSHLLKQKSAQHNKMQSQLSLQSLPSDAGYYSSVPVPLDLTNPASTQNRKSISQNNTLKHHYDIPWDLKVTSDSITTLNCSGSDLTMGYFANGRYYDPTPRQQFKPKKEIYAPASSYSDRSNQVFSTFVGDLPRRPSFSDTNSTDSNIGEDDDHALDNEGFPFDPQDATEPVEV